MNKARHLFSAFRLRALAALILLLATSLALVGLVGCSANKADIPWAEDGKPLHVVTSFYTMEDFVSKIGGDRVMVTNLVPTGTEPHSWEPSPKDLQTLEQADLFVYNGGGFEPWASDIIGSVQSTHLIPVEASKSVALLDGGAENALHNTYDEFNRQEKAPLDPHVWLDPQRAKTEMSTICEALCAADPEGADYYRANYEENAAKLDALDQKYDESLKDLKKRTLVVSHQAFGYLCNAYDLNQVPIEGLSAESEPDAKTMARIIELVNEDGVAVIFSEELMSSKVAQSIADATGARCETLNPLEGLTQEQIDAGEDYFSVMESNLEKIVGALS